MEYLAFFLLAIFIVLFVRHSKQQGKRDSHYDRRGFDHNCIHRNGTRFDDDGYDFYGYDISGYDRYGYTVRGRNVQGQYDRFHDATSAEEEGFCHISRHPVALTDHAIERLRERFGISDYRIMHQQVLLAYRYGKSKRQIKKTSAWVVEEIENKHNNSVVLIYKNFIYVFSKNNVLITVYKNDRIAL